MAMRKLLRVCVLAFGLLGLAHESSAQFCPGVSPWVFDDVLASDPFCGFVTKIANQGVTSGCMALDANHRLYCPHDSVTRLQMAAFMARLGNALFAQGGNAFGAPAVMGTTDAQPFEIHVNGARALRIQGSGATTSVAAGSPDNTVAPGVVGATIGGGGGLTPNAHVVTGNYGTIGGGIANEAYSVATVAGGQLNDALGAFSVIGGGYGNVASGGHGIIAGGLQNQATNLFAVVMGGEQNHATGNYSAIVGGRQNNANGANSVVMGFRGLTTANANGSFVYSDASPGEFGSGQPNEFLVGATGGIGMFTSKIYQTGCIIAAGGGQWQCFSSRDGKTDIAPVDAVDVLERVVALPISTWRYRGENEGIRHLGPMAQDFHAAFGLGSVNTSIGVLDGSGVAIAAIQGLHTQLRERDSAIAALRAQMNELAAMVESLARR
jgi:hypothetical protein